MERVEKLGVYYVYHNVSTRYGISFEQFIAKVDSGVWAEMVRLKQSSERHAFR